MRRGALRRVLLGLAAGVAGGALRLEHLPPEVLPAQESAGDLLIAGGREEETSMGGHTYAFVNDTEHGSLLKNKSGQKEVSYLKQRNGS